MKEKVVLAYSGGLDTTAIIPWLKETFDYEVICCCINVGQGEELDGLEERAKMSGASKLYIEDIVDEFCEDYIVPCVQANAIYENKEIPSELGLVIGTITNSQSLIDRALEAEEKEGGQMIMCKALEELRMEGVLQGRTEGIRATVKTCKKFQINKEAIIETIGKEFSMPEKEVAEYVEKYW